LKIVNVKKDNESNDLLIKDLEVLDRVYPEINAEFIEPPGNKFSYRISESGGVRLIM
jgi:hypothetical protein